ncbi:MAG: hypothetical protein ACYCV4_05480 [Dermatophilaceae bacterium]
MIIVGMAGAWAGYLLTLWGYTLVRGPGAGFTGGPVGGGWPISALIIPSKWPGWPKPGNTTGAGHPNYVSSGKNLTGTRPVNPQSKPVHFKGQPLPGGR